jgi:hypothetical protein
MLVLLNHGSRTNERDPSILYNLSREFAHELHYFEVGHQPRSDIREHQIASPGQWNSKKGFMLVLLDHCSRTNERDASIFYNLSGDFAHELHYFEVGHLPRRPLGKVTLNVQILESLHSEGTIILFGGFQIDQ